MEQLTFTNAAGVFAAGGSRLLPGRGICAYPWHLGDARAYDAVTGMNVAITESKHRFRWPGDPPS
jgi:hypothetical protein